MDDNIVKFERNIIRQGGSLVFAIPPEVIKFLELEEGSQIELIADCKEKGKFSAFWKRG